MRHLIAVILVPVFFLNGLSAQENLFNPYDVGAFNTTSISERRLLSLNLAHNLDVYSPIEGGDYPVIYFFPGFALTVPASMQSDMLRRIATHGYVVVGMSRILGPFPYEEKYPLIQDTIDWCKKHLQNELVQKGGTSQDLTINFDLSFALSHSAGGHVLCDYLTHTPSCGDFKAIAMMSPVDGPLDFCTTEGETLNFDIPTLILPAGLDNDSGDRNISCGPDDFSNARFYNVLHPSSPKWMVNSTEMGHADFMNNNIIDFVKRTEFCQVMENSSMQDYELYRSFIVGQVVSFIKGTMEETDCDKYFQFLEDISSMPISATSVHENPYQPTCFNPYCNWAPPSTEANISSADFP